MSDARFSVNRSASDDDWHGLVISDVQLSDAGLYTCIDNDGFGPPAAAARLVVLDALPTCGANVSADQPVLQSHVIQLRCTFTYAGSPPPRVLWTSHTGTSTPATSSTRFTGGESTARLAESTITVTAAAGTVSTHRYTITAFDDDDADDDDAAASTPTYVWYSPSFVVQSAVSDVVINASDDSHVAVGDVLQCRADGFPPARYEWTDVATGRRLGGPELRLDADGRHTYQCTATNVVANVTHSARARVTLVVIRAPATADSSETPSVTTAVVIATVTTAAAATLVVVCVLLLHRLSIVGKRRATSSSTSSTDSASAITRQQVRVGQPPAATAACHDVDANGRKRDGASCLYDAIDEQEVGYEQLPGGRLSAVQQAADGVTAAESPDTLPRPFDRIDTRRTPVRNDYLYVCDESHLETGQAGRRQQGQWSVGVRYVQPQQPQLQQQQQQCDELYVNAGLPTASWSAAAFDDVGVYIHTLSDDY